MNLCIICEKHPAVLPDRDQPGAAVCVECYAWRLLGDMVEGERPSRHPRIDREEVSTNVRVHVMDTGAAI